MKIRRLKLVGRLVRRRLDWRDNARYTASGIFSKTGTNSTGVYLYNTGTPPSANLCVASLDIDGAVFNAGYSLYLLRGFTGAPFGQVVGVSPDLPAAPAQLYGASLSLSFPNTGLIFQGLQAGLPWPRERETCWFKLPPGWSLLMNMGLASGTAYVAFGFWLEGSSNA